MEGNNEDFPALPSRPLNATANSRFTSSLAPQSLSSQAAAGGGKRFSVREKLPIDEFRQAIVEKIRSERVIIIHGETGCGKSSRIPQYLLEDAIERQTNCRMMISQPRRIAASTLMKRLRSSIGDLAGLRMGFGAKDESEKTLIHFVTTGYLVRLAAHHAENFENHSHLIIDEVHERSVDSDLLCLFAKRLLNMYPKLKVILMSATVHTELYKDYFQEFSTPRLECLSVGRKRFPLTILYPKDIRFNVPHVQKIAQELERKCERKSCSDILQLQFKLAVQIITLLVRRGTGVLVFVSGINDILDIQEKLEGMKGFRLFAIHSEIPFEEQEAAFLPTPADEVKVVLATNAAESSITLPDVDTVICLGTHKSLEYNSHTRRVNLLNSWISKASATQRAGRTGRLRPGTVYRLYSSSLHDSFQEFDTSDLKKTPLHDVILNLRHMLEKCDDFDGVVPVLEALIEPPDVENVDNSFQYLFEEGMITEPNDDGELTAVGDLVSQLPLDCQLGKLVAHGIRLGCAAECAIMAAALTQPKKLFRVVTPFIHTDPDEFNDIARTITVGGYKLDAGLYSEPMMHICLLKKWQALKEDRHRYAFCNHYGVVMARVQSFISSAKSLLDRINEAIRAGDADKRRTEARTRHRSSAAAVANGASVKLFSFLDVADPLPPRTQNMLRLIIAWCSERNILRSIPKKGLVRDDYNKVNVKNDIVLTPGSLKSVLKQCPCKIAWEGTHNYGGRFIVRSEIDMLNSLIKFANPGVGCINLDAESGAADCLVAIESSVHEQSSQNLKLICPGAEFHATIAFKDLEYKCYKIAGIEKKQKRLLRQISDVFVLVTSSGVAAVICDNMPALSTPALHHIFWGDEHPEAAPGAIVHTKEAQQVLEFDHPFDEDHTNSLIIDIPLGMRILNGCKMPRKDAKLHLRPLNTYGRNGDGGPSNNGKAAVPTVPVGSEAWRKAKQAAAEAGKNDQDGSSAVDDVVVDLKGISRSWGFAEREGKVHLSKNSYLSSSQHCGPEVSFAAAYNVIDCPGAGGTVSYAEGLTMLPVGGRWLSLARLCCGADPDLALEFCGIMGDMISSNIDGKDAKVRFGGCINRDLDEHDFELCGQIRHHLDVEQPLAPSSALITTVDKLFQDYYVIGATSASFSKPNSSSTEADFDLDEVDTACAGAGAGAWVENRAAAGAGAWDSSKRSNPPTSNPTSRSGSNGNGSTAAPSVKVIPLSKPAAKGSSQAENVKKINSFQVLGNDEEIDSDESDDEEDDDDNSSDSGSGDAIAEHSMDHQFRDMDLSTFVKDGHVQVQAEVPLVSSSANGAAVTPKSTSAGSTTAKSRQSRPAPGGRTGTASSNSHPSPAPAATLNTSLKSRLSAAVQHNRDSAGVDQGVKSPRASAASNNKSIPSNPATKGHQSAATPSSHTDVALDKANISQRSATALTATTVKNRPSTAATIVQAPTATLNTALKSPRSASSNTKSVVDSQSRSNESARIAPGAGSWSSNDNRSMSVPPVGVKVTTFKLGSAEHKARQNNLA